MNGMDSDGAIELAKCDNTISDLEEEIEDHQAKRAMLFRQYAEGDTWRDKLVTNSLEAQVMIANIKIELLTHVLEQRLELRKELYKRLKEGIS